MNHAFSGVLHTDKVLVNSVDGCSYIEKVLLRTQYGYVIASLIPD